MPKSLVLGLLLVVLAVARESHAAAFGIGASAGAAIPIVQDDEATGTSFSLRAILHRLPVGAIEAHLTLGKYGDPQFNLPGITDDLKGSTLTSYGIDALLGGGPGRLVSPYLLLGVGFFRVSRDQTAAFEEANTDFGYSAGVGIGIGVARMVGLDLRAKLNIVPADHGGSQKSAQLLGGLNYYFGI